MTGDALQRNETSVSSLPPRVVEVEVEGRGGIRLSPKRLGAASASSLGQETKDGLKENKRL